jgi:hypothetical protein
LTRTPPPVSSKTIRDLLLVGLKLVEGRPDRGAFSGGILQFDHRKRQAVDKKNDIGTPLVLVLDNRELVDGYKLVGIRSVIIQDANEIAADGVI